MILPASAEIKLRKPEDARSGAWVSLDGATRFKLKDGESIIVNGSVHPLKMVTLKSDNLTDLWAQRLTKLFGWNIRDQNKPLQKKKLSQDREDENMYNTSCDSSPKLP